jgi:biopolymer transport protein ExbD
MRTFIAISLVAFLLVGCTTEATYASRCGGPMPDWRKPSDGSPHHSLRLHVGITGGGGIKWNNKAVNDRILARYLDVSLQMNPLPFLIMKADDNAPCAAVEQVRALMEQRFCKSQVSICGDGDGEWQERMY